MGSAPREDVQRAYLDSVTELTNRIEIYEQDGKTPWRRDLWDRILVNEGSVSLDYSRDERRTFECALYDETNSLIPKAGGLWYDKVFKIFSGIVLNQTDHVPAIAIVEEEGTTGEAFALKTMLADAGYRKVRILNLAATYADVREYDIVASISADYPRKLALLNEAYANGKSVWTMAPTATASQVPECIGQASSTLTTTAAANDSTVSSAGTAHPLHVGWSSFGIDAPLTYRKIQTLKSGATRIADISDAGNTVTPTVIANEAIDRGRWVHMQQSRFTLASFAGADDDARATNRAKAVDLVAHIVDWLDTFVPLESWETQIFEGLADGINSPGYDPVVRVQGRDYTKLCMNSKLSAATQFTKGTAVTTIISSLAGNSGVRKINLPTLSQTIDKDMTWESKTTRWSIMKELATSINYDIFFTADGRLTMTPQRDPLTSPPTLVLSEGAEGNIVDRDVKTSDNRLFNHVLVIGESSDSNVPSVWAEAKNTTPGSPTNVDEIGLRTQEHSSSLITTTAQAQDLANSLLKVAALEEYELNFSAIALPWIEVGDIVELADGEYLWGPERYLISSLQFSFDLSPMSGSGKRVTQVV